MTTSLASLTLVQLRQALALKVRIEALRSELAALLELPPTPPRLAGDPKPATAPRPTAAAARPVSRRLVPEGRKPIATQRRSAVRKESGLLGLCLGADLPRPIRAARRKLSIQPNRVAAAAKAPSRKS